MQTKSYNKVRKILSDFPSTWYPALLIELIEAAHRKNVFHKYGATKIARQTERRIAENGKA